MSIAATPLVEGRGRVRRAVVRVGAGGPFARAPSVPVIAIRS